MLINSVWLLSFSEEVVGYLRNKQQMGGIKQCDFASAVRLIDTYGDLERKVAAVLYLDKALEPHRSEDMELDKFATPDGWNMKVGDILLLVSILMQAIDSDILFRTNYQLNADRDDIL